MYNFVQDILVVILTSSVMAGLFVFLLKHYIIKWISYEFEKRSRFIEQHFEVARKVDDSVVETQLGIYPEIIELTYRLRNIIRNGVKERAGFKWDPALRPLTSQLTEVLYKYRFFLSDDIFDKLHELKRIAQDAVLLVDVLTREEHLFDSESHAQQIDRYGEMFEQADRLFLEIKELVNEKIRSLQEVI